MHQEFKSLLNKSKGISDLVVAVNIDIRGFSAFCMNTDSILIATYIRKIYQKILNDYFKETTFFKPTGDGLLIIFTYEEDTLSSVIENVFATSFKLIKDFKSLCKDDPMINFPIPDKIGIGISRGPATRIVSQNNGESKILDYSSETLNLASRLMDFARPEGIVFDSNLQISLLPSELKKLFTKDSVYIKGVAEKHPLEIFHTKGYTQLSTRDKTPISDFEWVTEIYNYTMEELEEINSIHLYPLKHDASLIDNNQIKIEALYPHLTRQSSLHILDMSDSQYFKYSVKAGKPHIHLNLKLLLEYLKKHKNTGKVTIKIIYPIIKKSPKNKSK